MPEGQVLEFTHVTKRFNEVTAVSDFSARVEPGAVTAFLGPNGAGKTTTLRILLGQVRASSGTATIGGTAYAELRQPLRTIGSVLEETVYRPRRTAERQLTIAAKANGIPLARVGEVLSLVGLEGEGDSRIGGFSLGMRQRLSVAHALLGDPGALVFDEPANGLDPEGIRWMRLLMRRLADEGRTVLVSSHVLSEVEQVADNVLVLSKGQLLLASGIETLADPNGGSVIVDAADREALTVALTAAGFDIEVLRSGLTVRGGDAGTVGAVAADAGIALSTLVQRGPTLEDVFIDLMRGGRLARPAETAPAPLAAAESTPVEAERSAEGSLVAIPVSAAAAWAAEATAPPAEVASTEDAPTDEAPADEAAVDEAAVEDAAVDEAAVEDAAVDEAAVEDAQADETPAADEASAEEAPATEGAPTDEAPAGEALTEEAPAAEAPADEAPADETPAADAPAEETRSFDEILFGAAAPVAAVDPAVGEPEAAASLPAATDVEASAETTEEVALEDGEHAGVEIFADLDASSAETPDASADQPEEDPRSAAVSSMLAAAARAYYEDEPRDYPLSSEDAAEGAHWSVAATGVIDTVPLAGDDESAPADESEAASEHAAEGEHHDEGDNHEGEHHDSGDHHDGGDHHGDHHHG
ncbi:ATP-binding cassette domain-containing protein [Microbacterium algeriense]|uniref:ATP-binding cassette domain-containing protein n=1 Tax=Microbacterium algeriense TaxID=2615184 RepID=UPI0029BDFF07|nr:ATP-binding cassette domain-containing protein [Microbacterium algeriense]MDX2400443.1 ATP-binding cassette domain-containing protein [Microbacterium algeriense]